MDAEHREHIEQLIERRNEHCLARSYDALMNEIGVMATEAMGLLIEVVEQIPPESWDQPTNLDGWSMRDLVDHVTGSAAKIVTLVGGGEVWKAPSQPADWKREDPAARLRELAARLQDALPSVDLDAMRPSPEGEVPLRRALTYPVLGTLLGVSLLLVAVRRSSSMRSGKHRSSSMRSGKHRRG